MFTARCLEDDVIYTALAFSQLPLAERERKRQRLVCANLDCQGPAFFRRESRSGQAACFGARPHEPGCNESATDPQRLLGGEGEEVDELFNPGDRIELDLNFGAHQRVNVVPVQGAEGQRGPRAPRFVGDGDRPNAVAHKRLHPLLRTLIRQPAFATSEVEIGIPSRGVKTARNFFVAFDEARNKVSGNYYGFWGMVANAGLSNGTLWVNAGGRGDISFPMDTDLQDWLCERLDVTSQDLLEELAGCYMLVLGVLAISQNGKVFCAPESSGHIAIIKT